MNKQRNKNISSATGFDKYPGPVYKEALTPEKLFNISSIIEDLGQIDWAFEHDDTSFLTHDIHPYPAKFIPHIPGTLIARLSLRGDLVMDPFGGSGTTALEAIRLGRRALIIDANRVGILAGRVKTCRITPAIERDLHSIRTYLAAYRHNLPSPQELIERLAHLIPDIPNRSKWFSDQSCAELALIRSAINSAETSHAQDLASLAMSRIILRASYQDSETRYTAKPRNIISGEIIGYFLQVFDSVIQDIKNTAIALRYGVADFIEADSRKLDPERFPNESVDFVITSPPYGNAMDYHLYHRFRLFWLGTDPRQLARIEIGSHLRHQKESTGYENYRDEMKSSLRQIARVLRPGRFAGIIIGDSIYNGNKFSGSDMINEIGSEVGLSHVTTISRDIHRTKRSFIAAGRRATTESIVVLQRPTCTCSVILETPEYKLWPYEEFLHSREISTIVKEASKQNNGDWNLSVTPSQRSKLRKLTFSSGIRQDNLKREKTWQAVLENGYANQDSSRKDPKYVTHGLHPYKGKFYPQLAKSLINIANLDPGSVIFDPFCGSGTTLLEGYLNGLSAHGCDMNPLAAKIARAKVGILEIDPGLVSETIETLLSKLDHAPRTYEAAFDQFTPEVKDEIIAWFASPVIGKLNWLLSAIRSLSAGILKDYLEVVLSSIVREVSNQEPSDLRIRRRKQTINDADVVGCFRDALINQYDRLLQFWSVRGYCPFPFYLPKVIEGDSREWEIIQTSGIERESVDIVLTSPPYATALPYIDTDRLSILLLCGLCSTARRPLEHNLIGSREITVRQRSNIEEQIYENTTEILPQSVIDFIRNLYNEMNHTQVGFRRRNMPALLLRFFKDLHYVLNNVREVLKPGANAFVVMGDNITSNGTKQIPIPTTQFIADIAVYAKLELVEKIPITVTTENLLHINNAIKENVIIHLRRYR